MNDRFKFNAVVSSYYDIDTPEEYKEVEPQFYLKNVDVFCTGEISVDYDTLLEAVKEQSKDLTEKEIGQIMQHFEDNSNSPDCEFVSITPDKIIQCTGLKDKNGKLVYEGDVVIYKGNLKVVVFDEINLCHCLLWAKRYNPQWKSSTSGLKYDKVTKTKKLEVIGNIYENADLLKGKEQ